GAGVLRRTTDTEDWTPKPLPATQIIGASATPMNKAKIVKARTLFRKNKLDRLPLYMIYNSEILEQILVDEELTRWDRETIQNIMDGEIAKKWAGFIWLPYEELPDGAGGATEGRTFATAKGCTHFGRNVISNFDIAVRPDKSNVKQIGGITSYGAARGLEEKVVQIDFLR
ncbi:MAG TPA: phage capsid protein, partial [Acinetobacter johnsonii]|nr:phage capsid protein [Acinetobacter johnsonii]